MTSEYLFEKTIASLKIIKNQLKLCFDGNQKMVLKQNAVYKNAYAHKRCFIIGNGPSLKTQDLSLLKDEFVFTVNFFPKSSTYESVNSNFHVMMDPFIFQIDPEKKEDLDKIHTIQLINRENRKPVCFFPYAAKSQIEKLELHKTLNISYVNIAGTFYEGYKRKNDFTKFIPGFCNVVQYAVLIAMYMGFEEIYLLGCDMTGYEQISVLAGKEVELHAYQMTEEEKKQIANTHSQMNPETFFQGFYRMFADYRRLNEYAGSMNVKIFNATNGGVLTTFPRKEYHTLFREV